jgi:hypothetical protein
MEWVGNGAAINPNKIRKLLLRRNRFFVHLQVYFPASHDADATSCEKPLWYLEMDGVHSRSPAMGDLSCSENVKAV